MTYLLTGATGFLGTKLVNALLAEGHSVNYLGRKRSAHLDSRAAYFLWKPGEAPPLDTIPRFDVVVNLAGEPIAQRWNEEAKRRIRDSRVQLTHQLVDGLRQLKNKPAVLVSGSAVGYYGDRGDEILAEDAAPGQGFLAEVCVDWEREALRATEFGVRVVTVRTGVVLGTKGGALQQMLPLFRWGMGAKFGSGRQWMPWIHVQDLIGLFIFAAETELVRGAVNGSAPSPVRNADFTRALAHALHRPALFAIPRFALRAALGEMSDFLFGSLRAIPKVPEEAGFRFKFRELEPALQDLAS
ncbi:MAG: TIGR01777 family oxidoreductase [Bryobacteraceae bacterium]